jgi:hypothetical protein
VQRRSIVSLCVLLSLVLVSCNKDSGVEPYDYARDTPEWLKEKISVMSNDTTHFFAMAKVYRYKWREALIYHISIPLSSCMYCELYDQNGNRIQFSNDVTLMDFLTNRSGEILIWESKP